jgi:ATP-binding cassette, subfamily B, bacterial
MAKDSGHYRDSQRSRSRLRHLPVFTQMTSTECGAACLAMILTYYGHQTSILEVSTFCNIGRDGLSAANILRAARQYGLQTRAVALQNTGHFGNLACPAIIYWNFNHFLVVERWTSERVFVVDPAVGRKTISTEEFDEGFTGVALLLQPGEEFVYRRRTAKYTLLRTYIQNTLDLAPALLWQIFIASFLLLGFGLMIPGATAMLVNTIMPKGLSNLLFIFGLSMVGLILAQTILNYLRSIILIKLQAHVDTHLMVGFFDHLLSLPLHFFQMRSSGDILTRLESNMIIRDTVNIELISIVLDTVSIVVYLGILFWLSPAFALLSTLFGLIQVILMFTTNDHVHDLLKRGLEAKSKAQGYLTETLTEITTLKAAGIEQLVRTHWLRLFFAEMSITVRRQYFVTHVIALLSVIRTSAPLILLLLGAQFVISGSLPLGTMLALLSLSASFLTPLESLIGSGQQLQQVYAHLERIDDIMKSESEQHQSQVITPPKLTGAIQLNEVSFRYSLNAMPILHDINVTIAPGQKVAIVGRSGSGKSTLGKLLLGLYLPTQGEIFYDGIPLRSMNYQQVRAQFGVVMQDIGILNGSIRENISLNMPGIDLESIVQAAQAAAIHDDIMQMPMNYETVVAEGGSAISGGQRQRLALARALVRTPAILLLDEATSSLDVLTERLVEQQVNQLQCTQIIIAHRLSTIRHADLILAVDGGTIVERGTHEELLKRQGFYAQLIKSQLASREVESQSDLSLLM